MRPSAKPVAAAPIKKLLRAGFAGAGDGSQHVAGADNPASSGMGAHCVPRDSANLSGCPGLLPGSASAAREDCRRRAPRWQHAAGGRFAGAEHRGAARAPRQALLLATRRGLARSHRAEMRLISRHRCPLAVSQPLPLQNLLDSGGLGLMWGQSRCDLASRKG